MAGGQVLPTHGIYLGLTRLLKRYELVEDVLKIRRLLIYKSKSQVTKQPKAEKRRGAWACFFFFLTQKIWPTFPAPGGRFCTLRSAGGLPTRFTGLLSARPEAIRVCTPQPGVSWQVRSALLILPGSPHPNMPSSSTQPSGLCFSNV